ncbi:putative reverse transcriptase domain-containing protein [Tanacetum coccineum]
MPIELGGLDVIIGIDWLAKVPSGSFRSTWKKVFPIFLAHVDYMRGWKNKSEKKATLRKYPIVQDFSRVFPERPLGHRIDWQPLRIMKRSYQSKLKELSKKGFIEPVPHPGELQSLVFKKKVDHSRAPSGLAGFYREVHEGFCQDRQTMTKAHPEEDQFVWGEINKNQPFQLLKQKLCSAPILALPKGSEDFIAYCDASKMGLGRCVMHKRKCGDCLCITQTEDS